MKAIIFAGGTGKRFWPVSRKSSPKQFLPVAGDIPLLKRSYEFISKAIPKEDIFISSGTIFEKEIRELLPDLDSENLVLEPEMRDTGPAVTLAVTYVSQKFPDDVIAIFWSDQIIRKPEVFYKTVKKAEEIVKTQNKAVFVSVPARFPSPHRGYIKFDEEIENVGDGISVRKFSQFVEKPTKEVAEEYIENGNYGWNPGHWFFTSEMFLSTVENSKPEYIKVCREIVDSNFSDESLTKFAELEKISADYVFAENITPAQAVVMFADIEWFDVGEWIAVKEALQETNESNVIDGNVVDMDSKDCIIHNYDDSKLVSTIGLKGMVVVNTKDVVAIFHKDDNVRIKEYLKKLEDEGYDKYL